VEVRELDPGLFAALGAPGLQAVGQELLDKELARLQPGAHRPFPTLGEMIRSGKWLWVMAEEHGDPTGWYHRAYRVTQETPYSFKALAELETDASCRPSRGGNRPPLFLVNSWVETYPPDPATPTSSTSADSSCRPLSSSTTRKRSPRL
jgi:hypothetical protein